MKKRQGTETGNRKQGTGNRKQETGNRKQETGAVKRKRKQEQEIGNWKKRQGTGNKKQKTRNRKRETGRRKHCMFNSILYSRIEAEHIVTMISSLSFPILILCFRVQEEKASF